MEAYFNLAMAVLCTAWIMVGLRELQRWNIPLLQGITVNYFVAAGFGLVNSPQAVNNMLAEPGALSLAMYLGVMFITMFFLMGVVAQRVGVAYMMVFTKMSLVIPTLVAWLYYGDEMTALKGAGILVALGSVFLVSYRPGEPIRLSNGGGKRAAWLSALLLIFVFLGNGGNDVGFKIFNEAFSQSISSIDFTVIIFALSAIIGTVILTVQFIRGKVKFVPRAILGGIIIGIPNYFSLKYLIKSLEFFPGTEFFPINNIALLLLTGIVGVTLYKEKLNKWNIMGFLLALVAVVLLV